MSTAQSRRLGLSVLPGAVLVWSAIGSQHFLAEPEAETMLRHFVEDGETPAVVLRRLRTDGVHRVIHYGSAGPDARPLEARSVFKIGAITKTFKAALLADMAARGEVSMDDPVSVYLPDHAAAPAYGGREVTLLDLGWTVRSRWYPGRATADHW